MKIMKISASFGYKSSDEPCSGFKKQGKCIFPLEIKHAVKIFTTSYSLQDLGHCRLSLMPNWPRPIKRAPNCTYP